MDFGTLFLPVVAGIQAVIADILPVAIPVLVTLAGVSIALAVLGKFGVRR